MIRSDVRRNEAKSFSEEQFRTRLHLVLVALVLVATGLVARAVDLQILDDGFLEGQGDARYTRVAKHRLFVQRSWRSWLREPFPPASRANIRRRGRFRPFASG